jgi:hypothetical protein
VILILGISVVGAGMRFLPSSPFAPTAAGGPEPGEEEPTPTPTPTPEPLPFQVADVSAASLNTKGFLSWALMDRRSGEIWGSTNMTALSTTMSMIKAWVAADYLRLHPDPSSSKLDDLEKMVRDSDNPAAERIYVASGRAESIKRLIRICNLSNSKPPASGYGFGYTQVSAQDSVRMGDCIADGRAAGDDWTPQVLEWMRGVRGVGDFGIRKALPQAQQSQVAIKNGWDIWVEDKTYRVSCLAIGDTWAMAVLQRYPSQSQWETELNHTAQICQDAAAALLNPKAAAG